MSNIQNKNTNSPNKFRLDRVDGKIGGVCGGIANYMNVDPLIVRLIFAVGAIAGFGSFILLYLAIWLLAK
ncbi:PspC domain-containing protein [Aurantiacibacter sediminis]|uniref:PspC domain-containing protein n=1 Tax=Aurantiacibacter sediminis TaxID=2793064 RepID=A0ABS0N632_9SPHN|nr:PspC domain-containing protein [Aurantiacibacter sediminis]MBH5323236.1 PspC domain-containing protein [Aurantiacibacter sediminis]